MVFAGPSAYAQLQVNPQIGLNFAFLTTPPENVDYGARVGYQLGSDVRFGRRAYFQPGLFLGSYVSNVMVTPVNGTAGITIVPVEDDLVRTFGKLRAQVGYRLIDRVEFKWRLAAGPSMDVLLAADGRNGDLEFRSRDLRGATYNLEFSTGLDITFITLEMGAAYGLGRLYKDEEPVNAIDTRQVVIYFTAGLLFGRGGGGY
jgi:hypothetical protein